jgi:AcrR family transcriptional regulator
VSAESATSTRDRIVAEAMRLFGEQGYAATTVAEIEAAGGLSPGSGGLYRHFPSKRALLAEGVRSHIAAGRELVAFADDPAALAGLPVAERLAVLLRAGLRRLEEERDLSRLLLRDLDTFPDLLAMSRDGEIRRVHEAVERWLEYEAGPGSPERDWAALAAVVVGAVSHYWLLRDVFGGHPHDVDEGRYVTALVALAAPLLEPRSEHLTEVK